MPENIETEIRKSLDAKAHEVDVPDALAMRTLELAREQAPQPLWARLKDWRVTRRMNARPSGYPRVLYAAGAAATGVLVFVVGAFATRPMDARMQTQAAVDDTSEREERLSRRTADANPESGDQPVPDVPALSMHDGAASSGDAAGVTSSEDASVDAVGGNTSEEADAESGDADFSNQAIDVEAGDADSSGDAPAFRGLSAGDTSTLTAPAPGGEFLDPKLVKSANIRVAVKDFDPAWDQANDVAAKHGGAVIGSRTQQIGERIAEGTVTMRVPSAKLGQVMADLRSLGTLAELTTTGDDIADQIDGVKDKVADARTEERELIDQQTNAPTSAARHDATARLEAVRKNIDSLRAKQRKYEDQVEFSAVSATIFEDASVADNGSMLGRAVETGVSAALTILAGALVIVGGALPLALLALVVWFVVRTVRRRRTA